MAHTGDENEVTESTPLLDQECPTDSPHSSEDGENLQHMMSIAGIDMHAKWGEKYEYTFTSYEKLFLKHINRPFGEHLEVATRGAIFILILSLPFILHEKVAFFQRLSESKLFERVYTPGSLVYFLFSLYLTTGDTIHFAQNGIVGTAIAVLNIWLMQGLMPGGYLGPGEPHQHRWATGVAWGSAFIFLVLWLNLDVNTKIFCLSTHVWYFMAFLNEEVTSGFARNFELDLGGMAIGELLVATTGSLLAVVAAYLPYPLLAKDAVLHLSKHLMTHMQMCKRDFVLYYTGSQEDPMALNILQRELAQLQEEVGKIDGLLEAAWWECFGLGKFGRQRIMGRRLRTYLSKSIDLITTMVEVCQSEAFEESHVVLMKHLKSDIEEIVTGNGMILKICVAGFHAGRFTEYLKEQGRAQKEKVARAAENLTERFCQDRSEQGMTKVGMELAGEHVFLTTFCLTQKYTADLFDALTTEPLREERNWKHGDGLAGTFSPEVLFDKDHLSWALRNTTSILVTFFIGHFGAGHFVHKNNAAIASTVCVLLSKFVGSAMIKNMARMQGVVMGIVSGSLIYSFLGYCNPVSQMALMAVLFLVTLLGLFTYYHSESFSTVGLLIVVFSLKSMLQPCSDAGHSDSESEGAFDAIVSCTIAIAIMTCVDSIFTPERASVLARKSFERTKEHIQEALTQLFDTDTSRAPDRKGDLQGLLATTQSLGAEAALEPRYWRQAWPTETFSRAVKTLSTVRHCLRTIEENVLDPGFEKQPQFMAALQLESMCSPEIGVRSILVRHLAEVMDEVCRLLNEGAHKDVYLRGIRELNSVRARKTAAQWKGAMATWIEELSSVKETGASVTMKQLGAGTIKTLTDDPIADAFILVECLRAMFESLDSLLFCTAS